MRGTNHHGILIATLGSKAQVVTTALDLLLAQGHRIQDVIVLYPGGAGPAGGGPLAPALDRLRAEFAGCPAYAALNLRLSPLAGPAGPMADIVSQAEAEAAFRGIYRALWTAKRADPTVTLHLSITGGRKVLAVYALAAAQLLFDDDDRLWYVLAGGAFLESERLHPAPADEARLVPVPVLRWSTVSPVLTDLSEIDDPFQAADRQRAARLRAALDDARAFVLGSLTAAERRVVELLVREGLSDEQIANRLSLSVKTVGHHLSAAYTKARVHWSLDAVDRYRLISLLKLFMLMSSDRAEK